MEEVGRTDEVDQYRHSHYTTLNMVKSGGEEKSEGGRGERERRREGREGGTEGGKRGREGRRSG